MAELTGRALIASRCAKFFKNGDFVNLGIGVPLMCVNYLPEGVELWLEAEIGTVGSGPSPSWDDVVSMPVVNLLPSFLGEAFMITKLPLCSSAAVTLTQLFLVHCRSIRKAALPTGRFLANLFLVWAAPWISVPVSRRLSLQLITARRTVSPRFLRNVHCL